MKKEDVIKQIISNKNPIIKYSQIEKLLSNKYSKVDDKISNLVSNKNLIKIKRGIYATNENVPKEHISANLLQPSYVSFEYALSFYGMIPERVYHITLATTKRDKKYDTPFGLFFYKQVPKNVFHLGLTWHFDKKLGGCFFATAEKALCDKIRYDRGIGTLTQEKMIDYLLNDLRLNFSQIELNNELIKSIGKVYRSRNINTVAILIEKGKI